MIRLYIDVDGVLNPFPRMGKMGDFNDFTNHDIYFSPEGGWLAGKTLTVRLSRKMAEELKKLPIEIVFNTTWCDHPFELQELATHVGLEGTRQLYFEGLDSAIGRDYPQTYYADQKLLKMITDVREHGEPFIWVDDEAIDSYAIDTLKNAEDIPPYHLCTPISLTGLTMGNIEAMQQFISLHS